MIRFESVVQHDFHAEALEFDVPAFDEPVQNDMQFSTETWKHPYPGTQELTPVSLRSSACRLGIRGESTFRPQALLSPLVLRHREAFG